MSLLYTIALLLAVTSVGDSLDSQNVYYVGDLPADVEIRYSGGKENELQYSIVHKNDTVGCFWVYCCGLDPESFIVEEPLRTARSSNMRVSVIEKYYSESPRGFVYHRIVKGSRYILCIDLRLDTTAPEFTYLRDALSKLEPIE